MSVFKEHKIKVKQLLEFIPESLLANLSTNTNVDYYAKVLHGKKLFYTLIIAMLILIYKHANKIGYKTAKRRFNMELRNLVISLIVIECGGQPDRFFGP